MRFYNLDNEPMLWNSTHRTCIPCRPATTSCATAPSPTPRRSRPPTRGAQTLGPVLWGWTAYFWSALDAAAGGDWWNHPLDRLAHGNTPFVVWYLQQMKAYEEQHRCACWITWTCIIYPQGSGVFSDAAGDAATQALRLRSTRALWDPTYVDESWIAEPVYLIPRMRHGWRSTTPARRLAISEYNWGALGHINGALAQADVLGIFGREGLDLATLWTAARQQPAGSVCLPHVPQLRRRRARLWRDEHLRRQRQPGQLAIYAAQRASDGALTVMVINKTGGSLTSTVSLSGFTPQPAAAVYRYSAANLNAIQHLANQAVSATGFTADFPANSITLLVLPSARPFDQHQYLPLMKR